MFLTLILATFVLAVLTSLVVERAMRKPVSEILSKIVGDLAGAWQKYVSLGIYVMGISWGAPVGRLREYIRVDSEFLKREPLDMPHMALNMYETVIETLQGVTTLLLAFFVFTMIAYVIVRGLEVRAEKKRAA